MVCDQVFPMSRYCPLPLCLRLSHRSRLPDSTTRSFLLAALKPVPDVGAVSLLHKGALAIRTASDERPSGIDDDHTLFIRFQKGSIGVLTWLARCPGVGSSG